MHYDEKKELILKGDSSDYGVGAIILHIMSDVSEKPVAYKLRTLAPAERHKKVPSVYIWPSCDHLY